MPATNPTESYALTPKATWQTREINRRLREISAGITHHLTNGLDIPPAWTEEWNDLNERVRALKSA